MNIGQIPAKWARQTPDNEAIIDSTTVGVSPSPTSTPTSASWRTRCSGWASKG